MDPCSPNPTPSCVARSPTICAPPVSTRTRCARRGARRPTPRSRAACAHPRSGHSANGLTRSPCWAGFSCSGCRRRSPWSWRHCRARAPTGWCDSGWRPPRMGWSRRGPSSARSLSPTTAVRGSGGSPATWMRPPWVERSPRITSSASAAPRSPWPVCSCRRPVEHGLDIGSGCGIQALRARRDVADVVATDVSERALRFTRLNALLNGVSGIRHPERVAVRTGRGRAVRPRRLESALRHHPAGRRSARVRIPRRRNAGR